MRSAACLEALALRKLLGSGTYLFLQFVHGLCQLHVISSKGSENVLVRIAAHLKNCILFWRHLKPLRLQLFNLPDAMNGTYK